MLVDPFPRLPRIRNKLTKSLGNDYEKSWIRKNKEVEKNEYQQWL